MLQGESQPLVQQVTANQLRSMDFAFDRAGESRHQVLVIVEDSTHEAVAIEVERAISGLRLTRVLDRLALSAPCRRSSVDNGKEFFGKANGDLGYQRGVQLRLIQPGTPNQDAYV